MDIVFIYNELMKKSSSIMLINSFNDLKTKAKNANNMEYYYLSILKISDIYLDLNKVEDAINVLIVDLKRIDKVKYSNIYVSFLDRLIYLYIQKSSFRLAFKYTKEKRNFLDENNIEELNRWRLEMAYIYTKTGEIQNAILNYQAIIEDSQNDEDLSFALSNLTRIYIDQNLIDEAKVKLKECEKVTHDKEGIDYLKYLQAKIFLAEKKLSSAYSLFDSLFIGDISNDYLGIANEYLGILIDNSELKKAYQLEEKIKADLISSNDLELKKSFLANALRLNASNYKDKELISLFNDYVDASRLFEKINIDNEESSYKDEVNDEVNSSLSSIISKIEKVNKIDYSHSSSVREFLISYLSQLESVIGFSRLYIVKMQNNNLFEEAKDTLDIYDYTNKHLYERSISALNIDNTVLELALSSHDPIYLHINEDSNLINFINGEKYKDLGSFNLCAYPIIRDDECKYIVCMQSRFYDFSTLENSIVSGIGISRMIDAFINQELYSLESAYKQICELLDNNNYCLVHIENVIYLNKMLASALGIKCNDKLIRIDHLDYELLITNLNTAYKNEFLDASALTKKLRYTLKLKDKYSDVYEVANLISSFDKVIYYSQLFIDSSIEIDTNENKANIDSILETIGEENTLKYTICYFETFDKEVFSKALEIFGVDALKKNDGYYMFINNEINAHTMERLISSFSSNVSVLRFPKEIDDLDICLDILAKMYKDDIRYLTKDYLTKYLEKRQISKTLNENISSSTLVYKELNNGAVECALNVRGILDKVHLRENLNDEELIKYDNYVLDHIDNLGIDNYYIWVNGKSLKKVLEHSKMISNVTFLVDKLTMQDAEDLHKMSRRGLKFFLDIESLKNISAYKYLELSLVGVIIKDNVDVDQGIYFAKKNNLSIYSLVHIDEDNIIEVK